MMDVSLLLPLVIACAPNVAPSTVLNIIKTESSGNPYAININYGQGRLRRQPGSAAEAVAWAEWLYERGYNFDAGLMQINSKNFRALGVTPRTIFDRCTNIRSGAKILADNYVVASRKHGPGQDALHAALSMYNTGNMTSGFSNGYVNKVRRSAGLPPIGRAVASRRQAVQAQPSPAVQQSSQASTWNLSSLGPWGISQPVMPSPSLSLSTKDIQGNSL